MLMIWLKYASIVYENGISAPTPSTVASLNQRGAWKNTIASAGFCHFPIGILGQVWYLIVSIPDLCTLTTLLSGRGAGLFRTVFHILIKVERTNNGLKGT